MKKIIFFFVETFVFKLKRLSHPFPELFCNWRQSYFANYAAYDLICVKKWDIVFLN